MYLVHNVIMENYTRILNSMQYFYPSDLISNQIKYQYQQQIPIQIEILMQPLFTEYVK